MINQILDTMKIWEILKEEGSSSSADFAHTSIINNVLKYLLSKAELKKGLFGLRFFKWKRQ